jgi:hypothetical protein
MPRRDDISAALADELSLDRDPVGARRRALFGIIARQSNPRFPMAANDETVPAAAVKLFDEPIREVDDDRLDVYERARDALTELKAALPSAAEDIERLLEQINAAYWEVCGVPEDDVTPALLRTGKP